MSLAQNAPIAFIPTANASAARRFYEETLGLTFERDDHFAQVFRAGNGTGCMLRVVSVPDFKPVPYTVFGWEAADIEKTVDELTAKGIEFLRYSFFEQDVLGIWRAPDGTRVAWFLDPDGNTLSVSQHAV